MKRFAAYRRSACARAAGRAALSAGRSTRPPARCAGTRDGDDPRVQGHPLRRSRRSGRCAGARRRRCRAGHGVRDGHRVRPGLRPAAAQDRRSIYSPADPMPIERGLPDAQRLDARQGAKNAPVFVWIHGGALVTGSSREPLYDGAQLAERGVDRRVDQLPPRRARLARASRAERENRRRASRATTACSTRSRRCTGCSDNIAAFGGDPEQRHHRRRIRGRAQRDVSDGVARRARGLFAQGDRAERLHDLDARAEARRASARRRPRRLGQMLARRLQAPRPRGAARDGRAGAHRRRAAKLGFAPFGVGRRQGPAAPAGRRLRPRRAGAGADPRRLQPGRDPLAR